LEKLSSEELSQSLLKTGTDLKNNLSEKSANIGREIKSEGEMTIRKAFSTANRSMSTVTYSIFLFGAILVISFLFIFLNSTLVKY
jgi:hypothetical protein